MSRIISKGAMSTHVIGDSRPPRSRDEATSRANAVVNAINAATEAANRISSHLAQKRHKVSGKDGVKIAVYGTRENGKPVVVIDVAGSLVSDTSIALTSVGADNLMYAIGQALQDAMELGEDRR